MVDFSKRLVRQKTENKIHPIEIYKALDRSSEAGELRSAQEQVLNQWFSEFLQNRDVILKLHTGQGKTLIGLLILQSLLNQQKGPCLYICPNLFLVKQTVDQAKKFGIPYCVVGNDGELPLEFLKSGKLLICHVQKLFNGLTKFGLNNNSIKIGGIILDDSHACIEAIKEAFTIRIEKKEQLYNEILEYFEEDLEKQAIGTFHEVKEGDYDAIIPVPYWSWFDKSDQITTLLAENRQQEYVKFQWPLLKNQLENCQCLVSGSYIEISPYLNPIEYFGSFNQADHRILMSATTMNDSFFIKGLNISREAIRTPLTIEKEGWSGEKMILLPYMIHESLSSSVIIDQFAKPGVAKNFGLVAAVSSLKKAKVYQAQGCTILNSSNIAEEIKKYKEEKFDYPLVLVNRYDGIDLPDKMCRLLIIDSKPYSDSLADRYEEHSREDSNITNIKIAQKIEQGLGRSVRGEKDYSVILAIGGDLINFMRNPQTENIFHPRLENKLQ